MTTPLTTELLVKTLPTEQLVGLFRYALESREQLPPEEMKDLEESVLDFLARNSHPLAALLGMPGFAELHPAIAIRLLQRAHGLAQGAAAREQVARQARELNLGDCLPDCAPPRTGPLTASQQRAFGKLRGLAVLHFRTPERYGIALRTTPLIIGPTGVGKTHLVARLGTVLGLDVVRCTVGDWIVSGSRTETQTFRQVQQRLRTGKKFILHCDELDKIRGHNTDAWSQAQLTEIFNLLDRRVGNADWTAADRASLRTNVFMVGSGTWQEVWARNGAQPIGFAGTADAFDLEGQVRKARIIPTELLNRFGEWLVVEPMQRADFQRIADEMKLGPALLRIDEAVKSGLNFRAIENALTADSLAAVLREIRDGAAERPEPSPA